MTGNKSSAAPKNDIPLQNAPDFKSRGSKNKEEFTKTIEWDNKQDDWKETTAIRIATLKGGFKSTAHGIQADGKVAIKIMRPDALVDRCIVRQCHVILGLLEQVPFTESRESIKKTIDNIQGNFDEKYLFEERLLKEFEISYQLVNPNVVLLHTFYRKGHLGYFIMPRALKSLRDLMKEKAPFSEKVFWQHLGGVLEGIKYIQEQGIVHNDIKPGNILVYGPLKDYKNGIWRICDFGHSERLENVTGRTQKGPTQYASPWNVGQKTDIWSFACVTIESAVWIRRGVAELDKFLDAMRTHEVNYFSETPPHRPNHHLVETMRRLRDDGAMGRAMTMLEKIFVENEAACLTVDAAVAKFANILSAKPPH